MKRSLLSITAITAFLILAPANAGASNPADQAADQAKLQKEAKISMDEAKEIALKHVHNGKIESSELEREHGKLIYSFDVREEGRKDVTEVNVNAKDGKIVGIHHENAKKEATEKKQEAKEKH